MVHHLVALRGGGGGRGQNVAHMSAISICQNHYNDHYYWSIVQSTRTSTQRGLCSTVHVSELLGLLAQLATRTKLHHTESQGIKQRYEDCSS